ncbi:MAG: zinc carboxypeptidase [Flavobacteriaceae bacterium]|nr:zinc carboxypeptidase [Flavobacteriaceae bacterium]
MKKLLYIILILFIKVSHAQDIPAAYYLPQDISYNQNIPTPESILGFQVGQWHASHDKIVQYMYALAAASDRITIENRGTTYEGRPLLLLTITSPENHTHLEQIRSEHLKLSDATVSSNLDVSKMPLVVYQGFSIHGNEPSGANAGLLVAYYLAAAEGDAIETLLENTVILFDPSFNPDGLQRFSTWVNMYKNENISTNNDDREYNEAWPRGRTNHYWFDLNRDWLVSQLPETQARIRTFHQWKPNILTDHHEMGTNSTFFFQPGVPSRTHPLTPKKNQELTAKIGQYHAKALDKIGSLYYSEEGYDDFYYGKGSTFPDINGGIGILFEQASARGHAQDTDNGILTFPFAIRNQFTTALSTLAAAKGMRAELLSYQRDFYRDARNEMLRDKTKAIVIDDPYDRSKLEAFLQLLKRQQVKFNKLRSSFTQNNQSFNSNTAYVIPLDQPNYRMIKAMFEKRTTFADSLFYDISAWTLPLAFDLDYTWTTNGSLIGDEVSGVVKTRGSVSAKSKYAYLFEWSDYYTPKALYQILKKGLRAKVGMKKFSQNGTDFSYGTIMVPVQNQVLDPDEIYALIKKLADETAINFYGTDTGLTEGIDLGSRNFEPVKLPGVALLTGDGVTSYDAGEIWHLLDTRYEIPVTKVDISNLNRTDLGAFTTLIIPSTNAGELSRVKEKLYDFAKNGGIIIAYKNSLQWLEKEKFIDLDFKKVKPDTKNVPFEFRDELRGAQVIGGAIFEADVDLSHPVNFGYHHSKLALFRNTNLFIKPDSISNFKNAIQYTRNPLMSGYISKENLKAIGSTIPFKTGNLGKGKVIVFTDDTNFRAFWYGTNKLLANAIFFGKLM